MREIQQTRREQSIGEMPERATDHVPGERRQRLQVVDAQRVREGSVGLESARLEDRGFGGEETRALGVVGGFGDVV